MTASLQQRLEETYQELYEHTVTECQQCRLPGSCCSREYCEIAVNWAKDEYDTNLKPTTHPRLPLMGDSGCTAAPHLRPLCTVHTCEISSLGVKPGDEAWTTKYFKLRSKIFRLEQKRFTHQYEARRKPQ